MTLFIATTDGTTTFNLAQVEIDLITITKMDTGLGFTENATQVIEGVTTVPVTYVESETGPTPDRINVLVNNVGFTAPPHIIVFGVDDSFVLSDGTPLKGNGIAIPVGGSGNPFTSHVAALYDVTLCGGAGVWVDKEGGGTTQNTTDVVLYHELSHCFHDVTGTVASTPEQEEVNAETDENDERDLDGLPHRDVNSHNGGCGGGTPSCCIVASLATGSPYSTQVNAFRAYREQVLRRSDVGDDFFATFHYRYYGFSPEVVRLMGRRPGLSGLIRERYVLPLLAAVEMLVHYAVHRGEGMAGLVREQLARPGCADAYSADACDRLLGHLALAARLDEDASIVEALTADTPELRSAVAELTRHFNAGMAQDDVLRFALWDTVDIWLRAARALHGGAGDDEVDADLRERIAAWVSGLPISGVWARFSRLKVLEELHALDQFLIDPGARTTFACRLAAVLPVHAPTIQQWAADPAGGQEHHG